MSGNFRCLHSAATEPVCRAGFVVLFFLCVFVVVIVFNACDNRGGVSSVAREAVGGAGESETARTVTLEQAITDANAYKPQASADANGADAIRDPAVFELLRDEFIRQMEERERRFYGASGVGNGISNFAPWKGRSLVPDSRPLDRIVSSAPIGDAGRMRDIAYEMDTFALTWTYSNDGDYDLNGSVGVPDITAIANNYLSEVNYSEETYSDGRTIPSGDPSTSDGAANWYLAFIDTDKGGDIGIADITAIASNYLNDVAGYAVFANDDPNTPVDGWIEINRITLDQAKDALTEGFTFPIVFTATISEADGLFAMVRPYDYTGAFGDESEIIPLSTSVVPAIYAVAPLEGIEGTVTTFQVVTTGVAPIEYRWNFGGAFPAESSKESPTVILSTPGEYTCSVSATNDYGTDYFQFTLTVDEVPPPEYQTAFAVGGAYPQYGDAPLTTQLVCNMSYSIAGEIVYYEWDFESDGVNDVYQTEPYHITHEYPAGEYFATLTVMDEAGSKDTAKIYVVALSSETQWDVVKEVTETKGIATNSIGIFINPLTGGLPAMAYVTNDFKHCYMYEEYPGKWTSDTFTPVSKPSGSEFAPPIMLPDGSVIYAAMYYFTLSPSDHIGYVKRNADGTWYYDIFYVETSIANAKVPKAAVRPDGQPALLYNVGSSGDVVRYAWWDEDQWRREDTGIRGELYGTDFEFIDGNPTFTLSNPNLFYYEKTAEGWQGSLVAILPEYIGNPRIVQSDGILRIIALDYGFSAYERAEDGHWTATRFFGDWLDSSRGRVASDGSGYLAVYGWYDEPPFEHIRYSHRKISPNEGDGLDIGWESGIIIPGDDLSVAGDPVFAPGGVVYVVVKGNIGKAITLLSRKLE